MGTDRMTAYKLIETGSLVQFDVVKTDVQRPEHGDEVFVEIELQLGAEEEEGYRTEDWEWGTFGFIYVLGLLSFADGRPRGVSEIDLEENDELTVADLLEHLRFIRGKLRFSLDYLRGRCVKTDIDVGPDGRVVLRTHNRGEAALRWIDRLKGKKPLELVPS